MLPSHNPSKAAFPKSPAPAFLSLALSLSLSLGLGLAPAPARAQAVVAPTLSVAPNPAPAGKAFTLVLIGTASTCNTAFTRESVTVVGNRINLSYVGTTYMVDPPIVAGGAPQPADPICPVYAQGKADTNIMIPPYAVGPTFAMPALKAGEYEVWATQMYECLYSTPSCKIAVIAKPAGTLTVKAEGANTYTINPIKAAPSAAFDLSLLSYDFNCGTTFSNLAVNVTGNEITLTFLDQQLIGIACPLIYKPYGPTYKMPALKTGTYKVTAYRLPACYPCKLLGTSADAGTLTITGETTRSGWFLKNHETLAEKPFNMQLLNNDIGNCGTSFTHQTVRAESAGIFTSFLVESDSNVRCIQDLHPYGPTFAMDGLKIGVYPVYVTRLLPCQVQAPFCAILTPMPVPSDTLIVTKTLSVLLSDLRAGAPKADLRGSRAAVTLPEGMGGTWKAELLSVNGQRLSSATVNALGGERAEFDLGLKPERGVYLLRLSAPDGETHMLPLIRKD